MSTWLVVTLAVMPVAAALLAAAGALIVDAFASPRAAIIWTIACLLGAAAQVGSFLSLGEDVPAWLDGALHPSALGGGVYLLAALSLLAGLRSLGSRPNGGQVASLTAFAALAAAVLVKAGDLVTILIALEGMSLSAYALVASGRDPRALESAMKYFVQGSVATALLVYGIGLASTPTLSDPTMLVSVSAVLIVAGLAFKLGAAPFHAWVPDAYEHAPRPVSAFLSSGVKIGAFIALLAVATATGPAVGRLLIVFAALAVVSMVLGNLAALRQTSLTRMLGWSAVGQAGYALIALAVGESAREAAMLFIATYAVGSAASFIAAQALSESLSEWDGTVRGLAGAGTRSPWASAALSVSMLSLTGIPLTAGFWGKLTLFSGAIQSGATYLAVIGVVASVLSFAFYGDVLRTLYLDAAPVGAERESGRASRGAVLAAVFLGGAIIVLGFTPLLTGVESLLVRLAY